MEEGGSMRGMGLLPMRTVFTEEAGASGWNFCVMCMAFYKHFPVWLLADMKSTWTEYRKRGYRYIDGDS